MSREIDEICDEHIVLDDGQIVTFDEMADWLENLSKHLFVRSNEELPNSVIPFTQKGSLFCTA